MISFFKKFFKPKEVVIKFSELNQWLEDNTSELQKIKELFKEVEITKENIIENLKVLEKADISQAKVEDRVKTIVKGNLPAYTNAINFFLKKIITPEEQNYIELEIFCNNFNTEFENLNKRTFRNFQIIKEIVGTELENVAKSVKSLELIVKDIENSSAKFKKIIKIKEKIDFIKDSFENKEKNKLRKKDLEKEKEKLVESCKELKKDIEKLKKCRKAESLEKLKLEEGKFFNKLNELDNSLITMFSPFQKALKKYNNLFFIKKVDSYIANPLSALLKDSEFEILKFLKDVKKLVEEGKINLKEGKKKKILTSLDNLDESFLKNFINERSLLNKKMSSIKEDINSNTILKEILDLEKMFNITTFKIENIKIEIEKIKDVDIASEASKLEKKLSKIFGYTIRIENVMG